MGKSFSTFSPVIEGVKLIRTSFFNDISTKHISQFLIIYFDDENVPKTIRIKGKTTTVICFL